MHNTNTIYRFLSRETFCTCQPMQEHGVLWKDLILYASFSCSSTIWHVQKVWDRNFTKNVGRKWGIAIEFISLSTPTCIQHNYFLMKFHFDNFFDKKSDKRNKDIVVKWEVRSSSYDLLCSHISPFVSFIITEVSLEMMINQIFEINSL